MIEILLHGIVLSTIVAVIMLTIGTMTDKFIFLKIGIVSASVGFILVIILYVTEMVI